MNIFSCFTDMFGTACESSSIADNDFSVNPANGLPMVGGIGGTDVEGNPFGADFSHDYMASSSSDDSFSTITNFDDNWN